jgi:signal peptidase I
MALASFRTQARYGFSGTGEGMTDSLKCLGTEFYGLGKELAESGISMRLELNGYSMYPFIRDGDVAQIAPISMAQTKVGDIVFFRSGDRLLAHRVVRRIQTDEGLRLMTKGDSLSQEDRFIDTEADLVGRVETVLRNGRTFRLDRRLSGLLGRLIARSRFAHFCLRSIIRLSWRWVRFLRGSTPGNEEHLDELGT